MTNLEEKTIKKEVVYEGLILDIEIHDVLLPDGTTSKREILKHNGAVAVLPVTADGKVLLVEQYRKAVEMVSLEIPAGKLDKGEERITCAVRELQEETGYSVSEEYLEEIITTHLAIGYSSEKITLYYVGNLTEDMRGKLSLDKDEFLNVKTYTLEEAFRLVDDKLITDSKTIIALQWLRNRKA